jgi:hypothetical protein
MRGSCRLALQKCLIRCRINIRPEIDICTCIPLTHTKRSKAEKTWGLLVFGGAEIGWNIYRFGIVVRHSVWLCEVLRIKPFLSNFHGTGGFRSEYQKFLTFKETNNGRAAELAFSELLSKVLPGYGAREQCISSVTNTDVSVYILNSYEGRLQKGTRTYHHVMFILFRFAFS